MLSSSEVLVVLLKAMGAVVGVAVVILAVFLITKDAAAQKALAKASEAVLVLGYFISSLVAGYAKAFGLVRFNHLVVKKDEKRPWN